MTNWAVFHSQAAQPSAAPVLSQPGEHTLLTVNTLGQARGAQRQGQTFNHPWRPFLGVGAVTFNLATVSSFAGEGPIEPTIKVGGEQLRMSGKTGSVPTPLVLAPGVANKDGISWAVLEVHPDVTTGELMKDSLVEIVHSGLTTVSHTLNVGRIAIAKFLWSGGQVIRANPIVHFNLRYLRQVPTAGGGAPRHLFL